MKNLVKLVMKFSLEIIVVFKRKSWKNKIKKSKKK